MFDSLEGHQNPFFGGPLSGRDRRGVSSPDAGKQFLAGRNSVEAPSRDPSASGFEDLGVPSVGYDGDGNGTVGVDGPGRRQGRPLAGHEGTRAVTEDGGGPPFNPDDDIRYDMGAGLACRDIVAYADLQFVFRVTLLLDEKPGQFLAESLVVRVGQNLSRNEIPQLSVYQMVSVAQTVSFRSDEERLSYILHQGGER